MAVLALVMGLGVWLVLSSDRFAPENSFSGCLITVMLTPAGRIQADLEAELKKISDAGEPLKMTDLAQPPVADAENAAVVYQQAFDAIVLSDTDKTLLANLMRTYEPMPARAIPQADLDRMVKQNREALELLAEAVQRPQCRFNIRWEEGMDVEFPHLKHLRDCTRVKAAEIAWYAGRGDLTGALQGTADTLTMVRPALDTPTLIGVLVGYSMLSYSLGALECVLYEQLPPTEACRALYSQLGEVELFDSLVDAVRGDRAMGNTGFDETFAMIHEKRQESIEQVPLWVRKLPLAASGPFPLEKLFEYDQVQYLRIMREQIAVLEMSYREADAVFVKNHRPIEEEIPKCCMMSAIMLPVFGGAFGKRDVITARVGLAQVALALKAYKNEQGEYPESLAELREVIDWGDLPEDPFSGGDFIYRREGQGFVIYSVGVNLKDDGGKAEEDWEEGDIVWRCAK